MAMIVKVKRLSDDATMPTYGSSGSACFDLYAAHYATVYEAAALAIGTGLAFEIPTGHALMLYSRSGHGKLGVRLANCVGVIDSDYRGEVKVMLANDGYEGAYTVKKGDRIAQGMIVKAPVVLLVETAELSETKRGAGGFGSTGK